MRLQVSKQLPMMMVHSHYTHMTRACMQSSVQTSGREFYKKTTLAEPKQQFYLTLTQHNKNTTLCRNSKLKKYHRQVISNDMKIVYTIFECISLGNSYLLHLSEGPQSSSSLYSLYCEIHLHLEIHNEADDSKCN